MGDRVEALLGPERQCTGGVVIGDNGGDGTYWVVFDTGHEFTSVAAALLCPEESRAADLEAQLAQLRWRKMQNDAQIKTALEQSRAMAEQDLVAQLSRTKTSEKAEWARSIIEDELSKPLEVSEQFMRKFEAEEQGREEGLSASKRRHAASVRRLAATVVRREESLAEKAAKLSRLAAESARETSDIHNKIIQTKHVLQVDYMALGDRLEAEDVATMKLLEKRVAMLSATWADANARTEAIHAKVSSCGPCPCAHQWSCCCPTPF